MPRAEPLLRAYQMGRKDAVNLKTAAILSDSCGRQKHVKLIEDTLLPRRAMESPFKLMADQRDSIQIDANFHCKQRTAAHPRHSIHLKYSRVRRIPVFASSSTEQCLMGGHNIQIIHSTKKSHSALSSGLYSAVWTVEFSRAQSSSHQASKYSNGIWDA